MKEEPAFKTVSPSRKQLKKNQVMRLNDDVKHFQSQVLSPEHVEEICDFLNQDGQIRLGNNGRRSLLVQSADHNMGPHAVRVPSRESLERSGHEQPNSDLNCLVQSNTLNAKNVRGSRVEINVPASASEEETLFN